MASTSGEPYEWPFELFDPSSFKAPKREVDKVYINCDGWDILAFRGVALVEEINRWHRAEGWHGICWHFIIDKGGAIITGRSLEETPIIYASGVNGKAIVISVHGLWHFTTAQLQSLTVLCRAIDREYMIERKTVTFHGISEVLPIPSPTFNYKALLGLNSSGVIAAHHLLEAEKIANAATIMEPLGEET